MPPLLVLYDGHCPLCHNFIRLILRYNKANNLMFASLQSNTAKALAKSFQIPEHTDSVIFLENNQLWLYEEAAFRIANYCKAPLSFIAIANLLPSRFNRWVYTGIARNRKKWFGAYTTCPLPATRFRHRFITD